MKQSIHLCAPFSPPGHEQRNDLNVFAEVLLEARERNQKRQWAALNKRRKAVTHAMKLLRSNAADYERHEAFRRAFPTPQQRKEFLENLISISENSRSTGEEEELKRNEKALRRDARMLREFELLSRAALKLSTAAHAGDKTAAAYVVDAAVFLCLSVKGLTRKQPATVQTLAGRMEYWPFLVSAERSCLDTINATLDRIQLGGTEEPFRCKFRTTRGADADYPSRQWAKAAVRCIEETRVRHLSAFAVKQDFFDVMWARRLTLEDSRPWVTSAMKLPAFTRSAVRGWARVVRTLVRYEMPQFHACEEWTQLGEALRRKGHNGIGRFQNAVLDDIVAALRTIAP